MLWLLLLTKLKSNVVGNIAVVATKYPSSRNKYPIPNSDILIYSKGNVTKFNFMLSIDIKMFIINLRII